MTFSIIRVSICPDRPTKGMPWASSSAPGASPMKTRSASGLPAPKTWFILPAPSPQRRQPSTAAARTSSVISAFGSKGRGGGVNPFFAGAREGMGEVSGVSKMAVWPEAA